ncbi:MAG TPA: adenylate/guanylate cyclase domain-containing protein [Thermodesulfobacteriota bacterium]|nr:adenylate/guanylate cyclase domain-containing protein [Thermodesulfobacteriota bacterium]
MGWSRMIDFDNNKVKTAIILVLAFIITSAVIAVYNNFFYTSRYLELKAQEVGSLIESGGEFDQVAKELLNTRADLAYLRLVGENGEIKESFGNDRGEGIRRFRLSLADNQTVIFGLREIQNENSIIRPLFWSIVIGLLFAVICILGVLVFSSMQSPHLEKLIGAMKRVARGDLTGKLSLDKSVQNDNTMIRLFETFNQMVDQIRRREGSDVTDTSVTFQPAVINSSKEDTKQRKVTSFVAKITNFEELSKNLNSGELTSFLAEYRKTASSVVSSYGGVVDSLLQDEIVALFNVPDEQDNPELKAVCTGVELLQILSDMNTNRRIEGKEIIGGKVGIEVKAMPFYGDDDIPQGVKGIIDLARRICDKAPQWNILVSSDLYTSVSDYVEVKEYPTENGSLFSIMGVDEEIMQA